MGLHWAVRENRNPARCGRYLKEGCGAASRLPDTALCRGERDDRQDFFNAEPRLIRSVSGSFTYSSVRVAGPHGLPAAQLGAFPLSSFDTGRLGDTAMVPCRL